MAAQAAKTIDARRAGDIADHAPKGPVRERVRRRGNPHADLPSNRRLLAVQFLQRPACQLERGGHRGTEMPGQFPHVDQGEAHNAAGLNRAE